MTTEPERVTTFATCGTNGCGNEGRQIQVSALAPPATPNVVCGVCGNPIGDITGTPPSTSTEVPTWLT